MSLNQKNAPQTITIDGVEFVRADKTAAADRNTDGLEYVIIRANRAGVFAGFLKTLDGTTATMVNARRIYYWAGAATLSELAVRGTSKPKECKFPVAVPNMKVLNVEEVISVSKEAKASIDSVAVWSA